MTNIRAMRIRCGMKQKELVDILQVGFPKFSASAMSQVENSDSSGVCLTAAARGYLESALGCHKKEKRRKPFRWSLRVDETAHERFKSAMRDLGFASKDAFLHYIIWLGLRESEKGVQA